MKYAELKKLADMSETQLNTKLDELLGDRFGFLMQKGLGQLGQTHIMRETRRDIARVRTHLRMKEGGGR